MGYEPAAPSGSAEAKAHVELILLLAGIYFRYSSKLCLLLGFSSKLKPGFSFAGEQEHN